MATAGGDLSVSGADADSLDGIDFSSVRISYPAESTNMRWDQFDDGYEELISHRRVIINRMSEVDEELKEHEMVLDTLKESDGSRKCYQMIGSILVERTVAIVLPAIRDNNAQLIRLAELLSDELDNNSKELEEYCEKIRLGPFSSSHPLETSNSSKNVAGVVKRAAT